MSNKLNARDREIYESVCKFFIKGASIKEACRAIGITEQTLGNIRRRLFGIIEITEDGEAINTEAPRKKSNKRRNNKTERRSTTERRKINHHKDPDDIEVEFIPKKKDKNRKSTKSNQIDVLELIEREERDYHNRKKDFENKKYNKLN